MNRTIAGLATAGALGASLLMAAPAHADTSAKAAAYAVAVAQKGDPYKYGATGPNAFDCSGLALYAYGKAGKKLPRTAAQQYTATRHISAGARQVGDLVFIGSPVYHVGVYAGSGKMINANTGSYRGRKVVLAPISEYGGPVRYGQVK